MVWNDGGEGILDHPKDSGLQNSTLNESLESLGDNKR